MGYRLAESSRKHSRDLRLIQIVKQDQQAGSKNTYFGKPSPCRVDCWDYLRITECYCVRTNTYYFSILLVHILEDQVGTLCCNPLNSLEVGDTGKERPRYVPETKPCSPKLQDNEQQRYTYKQRDNWKAAPRGA